MKKQKMVHYLKKSLRRPCMITNDVLKVKKRTQEEKKNFRKNERVG